mgnify:FL=1
MSKVVDITDKLNFEESPKLIIKGEEYTVDDSAETMLKMMALFDDKTEAEAVPEAFRLLFSESDRKKISELKLNFKNFATVIECAMNLIRGVGDDEGSPS